MDWSSGDTKTPLVMLDNSYKDFAERTAITTHTGPEYAPVM